MIEIALLLGAGWALLALVGMAVIAWLPESRRAQFLPAAPCLGAAALVITLHATSLVMSVETGLPLVAAGLAGAVAYRSRQVRWWRFPARAVRLLLVATVVGVPAAGVALIPEARVGEATVVHPTYNHDAFSYVSVSEWLSEHRALDRPDGEDPPAFGYTRAHIRVGLRLGEELVQAAFATATGRDPVTTWYVLMVLWVLLLPSTFMVATDVLGLGRVTGLVSGALVGLSALLIGQAYTNNSASLLGVAMVPLAVALIASFVESAAEGTVGMPAWFVGLFAAAFAGTYTEYLPLVAPGLLAFLFLRPPARLWAAAPAVLRVGAWALLPAPLIWYNAGRSLAGNADLTAGTQSAYLDVDWATRVGRALGMVPTNEAPRGMTMITGLLVVVAIGVVAVVVISRQRRLFAGLLAGSALVVVYLSTVQRFPYGQQRAVEIAQPLWLFAVVVGLAALLRRARDVRRIGMPLAAGAGVALLLTTAVYVRGNYDTVQPVAFGTMALDRNVDRSFRDADRWLDEVAGPEGRDAMILDGNLFQQLWLTYMVRNDEEVAFPFVHPDYLDVTPYGLFDGTLRRFAVVGPSVHVSADPAVFVGGSGRYRYLDLSKGEALLAIPSRNFHVEEHPTPTTLAHWMADNGEVVVLRTPGIKAMRIKAGALDEVAPLDVAVAVRDRPPFATVTFPATTATQVVVLPPGPSITLVLRNRTPARVPSRGVDPRTLALYVSGIERA